MASTADHSRSVTRSKLTELVSFASASHARAALILIALSLVAFIPGFFQIPPIDREEARFAQASKQMIEGGDYLDTRFQNQVRSKTFPGAHWLQAVVVSTAEAAGFTSARTNIWLYRLPSLFGAIAAVLLTYWAALAFVSRRASLMAAGMMATSLLLGVQARLAKADALLLLCIVAAMGALARVYLTARRKPGEAVPVHVIAIFWTALAAGVLIKGVAIVLMVGFTVVTLAVLDRSWRWPGQLRPIVGLLWFAALVAVPLALILSAADEAGVAGEITARLLGGFEGHGGLPGYYLVLFWLMFWPGAVLAGLVAPMVWRVRSEPGAQFLLAWLVPSWLFFELIPIKAPYHVLPLYPAVAILIAGIIERGSLATMRGMQFGLAGWMIVPLVFGILTVAGFIMLQGELGLLAWPFAAGAVVMGLFAWRLFDLDGAERALLRAFAASLLITATIFGLLLPSLTALFPSRALATAIRSTNCAAPAVAAAGYYEPSLVFLLGTQTRLTDAAGTVEFLREGDCHFAILQGRHERVFAQHAEASGLRYAPLTRVEGFNFSTGRRVNIAVFRSAAN
jgi:4-amino-4-deoxy-L-arabinose transferase-like glycosyltransferase